MIRRLKVIGAISLLIVMGVGGLIALGVQRTVAVLFGVRS